MSSSCNHSRISQPIGRVIQTKMNLLPCMNGNWFQSHWDSLCYIIIIVEGCFTKYPLNNTIVGLPLPLLHVQTTTIRLKKMAKATSNSWSCHRPAWIFVADAVKENKVDTLHSYVGMQSLFHCNFSYYYTWEGACL